MKCSNCHQCKVSYYHQKGLSSFLSLAEGHLFWEHFDKEQTWERHAPILPIHSPWEDRLVQGCFARSSLPFSLFGLLNAGSFSVPPT